MKPDEQLTHMGITSIDKIRIRRSLQAALGEGTVIPSDILVSGATVKELTKLLNSLNSGDSHMEIIPQQQRTNLATGPAPVSLENTEVGLRGVIATAVFFIHFPLKVEAAGTVGPNPPKL